MLTVAELGESSYVTILYHGGCTFDLPECQGSARPVEEEAIQAGSL